MLGHSFVDPDMVMPSRKQEVTAAQIIFNRYYRIRISGIHLLDEAELERFGSVTSGSAKDDVAIASSVRWAQMTIAGMAVILADGATFALEDMTSANEIFETIQTHLIDWIKNIDGSFNKRTAPMEGLRELEALAEYLYPFAMRFRNATQQESHLYRSLRDAITRRGSIRRKTEEKPTKEEQTLKPYRSITDDMTKELERRGS